MPSEVLSACIFQSSKQLGLVVNGFTRVSAPDQFIDSIHAGFIPDSYGVPYMKDVCYIGKQYEFQRDIPWMSDDNQGFGASYADYAPTVIAGNMFDYPALHGQELQKQGISYISTSLSSIKSIDSQFTFVDLILGKQKLTTLGVVKQTVDFKTLTHEQQEMIAQYINQGGRLLVSGAYLASDLNNDEDKPFLNKTLHVKCSTRHATARGEITLRKAMPQTLIQLQTTPHPDITVCEDPDGIDPIGEGAFSIGRYNDTQVSAAVAWEQAVADADPETNKQARTLVFAFPLESVLQFSKVYSDCLNWLLR